jgi:hypothetical protein
MILTLNKNIGLERDEENRIHFVRNLYGQWTRDNDFSVQEFKDMLESWNNSGVRFEVFTDPNISYKELQETYKNRLEKD